MKKIFILSILLLCVLVSMLYSDHVLFLLLYWIVMLGVILTLLLFLVHKKWKHSIILLLIFLSETVSFYLLGVQIPPIFREVLDEQSKYISKSKEANAFICDYSLIYRSKYDVITKESFAEYGHAYKSAYSREFLIYNECVWFISIIDNIEDLRQKDYDESWYIEGCNSNRIVLPKKLKDTIVIHLRDFSTKKNIDSLVFLKNEQDK